LLQLRIDERGHGQISFTDFEKLFGDEGVKAFFEALQIGAVDAWTLFTTLETWTENKLANDCASALVGVVCVSVHVFAMYFGSSLDMLRTRTIIKGFTGI